MLLCNGVDEQRTGETRYGYSSSDHLLYTTRGNLLAHKLLSNGCSRTRVSFTSKDQTCSLYKPLMAAFNHLVNGLLPTHTLRKLPYHRKEVLSTQASTWRHQQNRCLRESSRYAAVEDLSSASLLQPMVLMLTLSV